MHSSCTPAPGTQVPGAGPNSPFRHLRGCNGYTAVELLFACALGATLTAVAIPATSDASDELRTAMAARYLSSALSLSRLDAVKRSSAIGLRFEAVGDDYRFVPYLDGNANGIRAADITAGIDTPLRLPAERLRDRFGGVRFGLLETAPDVDGVRGTGGDGVRIGIARIETMSPDGWRPNGNPG